MYLISECCVNVTSMRFLPSFDRCIDCNISVAFFIHGTMTSAVIVNRLYGFISSDISSQILPILVNIICRMFSSPSAVSMLVMVSLMPSRGTGRGFTWLITLPFVRAEAYELLELYFWASSLLIALRFFGLVMSASAFFSETIIRLPKTSSPLSRFKARFAMSGLTKSKIKRISIINRIKPCKLDQTRSAVHIDHLAARIVAQLI